jgi:hypothetical protein
MTVPSLYRLPYIAPLDLYRIPYIVWVSSLKAALYTSLNLKSVTVGKIWLQKIQINHKNKKNYNRFFRFLELL